MSKECLSLLGPSPYPSDIKLHT